MVKIEGSVEIKTPNLEPTIGAYKKLKSEIKEAKDELATLDAGTEAYTKKANQIGNLTNQIDDMNKSISAVSGAPMENLTGSFDLLSNQFKNLDLDGATASFKSLWATIVANPFIALVSVLTLVIQNWEQIIKLIDIFTGKSKLYSEQLQEQYEIQKKINTQQTSAIDNQIRLLEALGGNEAEILRLKNEKIGIQIKELQLSIAIQEQLIKETKQITLYEISLKALAKTLGFLTQSKELEAAIQEKANASDKETREKAEKEIERINLLIKNLQTDQKINVIGFNAFRIKKAKETAEELLAIEKKLQEELSEAERTRSEARIIQDEIFRKREEDAAARKLKNEQEEDERKYQANEERAKLAQGSYEAKVKLDKEIADGEIKLNKEKEAAILEGQKLATQSAAALSGLLYNIKAKNLEKGSKAEQEAAKKAFELDKGVQISLAVINGIQATLAAFASGSKFGPVVGAAYATAAGIVAAANIAKIKNTKFVPTVTGDSSTSGGVDAPSINTPAPIQEQSRAPIFQPTTGLNPDGSTNTTPGALTVSEGEITDVQQRVEVLEGKARF